MQNLHATLLALVASKLSSAKDKASLQLVCRATRAAASDCWQTWWGGDVLCVRLPSRIAAARSAMRWVRTRRTAEPGAYIDVGDLELSFDVMTRRREVSEGFGAVSAFGSLWRPRSLSIELVIDDTEVSLHCTKFLANYSHTRSIILQFIGDAMVKLHLGFPRSTRLERLIVIGEVDIVVSPKMYVPMSLERLILDEPLMQEGGVEAWIDLVKPLPRFRDLNLVSQHLPPTLDALSALTQLSSLVISYNDLSDDLLATLPALPGLRSLDISSNYLTSLAALEPLKMLTALYTHDSDIQDFSPLATLPLLSRLRVDDTSLDAATAALPGLATMCVWVRRDPPVYLDTLERLTGLCRLELYFPPEMSRSRVVSSLPMFLCISDCETVIGDHFPPNFPLL